MGIEKVLCPKCKGEMVQGFVPDHSPTAIIVSNWHQGQPERTSFWAGMKTPRSDGIPIGAFRCEKCGLREFYLPGTGVFPIVPLLKGHI